MLLRYRTNPIPASKFYSFQLSNLLANQYLSLLELYLIIMKEPSYCKTLALKTAFLSYPKKLTEASQRGHFYQTKSDNKTIPFIQN